MKAVKILESQLEYAIEVVNALFSTSLPSSSRRLTRMGYDPDMEPAPADEMDESKASVKKEQPWQNLDFAIVQKVINLFRLTT